MEARPNLSRVGGWAWGGVGGCLFYLLLKTWGDCQRSLGGGGRVGVRVSGPGQWKAGVMGAGPEWRRWLRQIGPSYPHSQQQTHTAVSVRLGFVSQPFLPNV